MVNDGRTFAMSCGKADALLFGLYLCLCAACFFPRTAGFSDEWLLPKWYLALAATAVLAMAEGYLFYIRKAKGHSEVPRSRLFSAALSIVATLESLYALGLFFLQGDAGGIGAMGTFDNPAGLALCLCLSLPFMYHFARHSRSGTLQLATYVAMCARASSSKA